MDIIDKYEELKKSSTFLELLNLKAICFGNTIYLLSIVNPSIFFELDTKDSYYGINYKGKFKDNTLNIYIKNDSIMITLKNNLNRVTIRKETIEKKDTIILENEKVINGHNCQSYILLTNEAIEHRFNSDIQKIKLYFSLNELKYNESNNNSTFDFNIKKLSRNSFCINASNLPYLNAKYIKKASKMNNYVNAFLNDEHIKDTINYLENEMSKSIPNLKEYLSSNSIYNVFNSDNNIHQSLISNLIYDGKALKKELLK